MKRILTLLTLMLGFVLQGQSQLLPANQCESSPCGARPICGNTITSGFSFVTSPASNPIGTCASSTGTFAYSSNWVYYRFTCYSTGTFTMRLNSNDSATIATDLDWAMWDITTSGCSALTTANVVECNAAGAGPTGILTAGTPSANFENNVTITAGNTYIIGISNPTGTNTTGFTMNFGGTASITDNKKPYMVNILPFDPCSPVTNIKIKLSEPVRCDQLNAGVDYTFSPAAPSFTAAALGCSGCVDVAPNNNPNYFGNATDTVSITFATALTPGTYTITPVANAWRDLCSNSDSTQVTLVLVVPAPFKDSVRSGFNCTTLKYIDTVYGVNGLSPYQYKAVGGGLPAAAGTYGPVGGTPGYTVYTVSGGTAVTYSIKDNGGCEVDTTINRPSVLAMSSPNLSLSSNPPCHDQFALDSITSINQTGGTPPYTFSLAPTYPWTFVAPNKWKNINFSPALGVTFTVTVTDAYGCTKTGVKNLVNPSVVSLTLGTPTNPQCNGDSTGKICFAQATGGTPGSSPLYTYGINPSYTNTTLTTTPTFCYNNLPAGTYTVIATDANACTVSSTKILSQPSLITINTSAATILNPTCPANCNGAYQPIATGGTGGKKFYKYPYIGPGLWDYTDSVVTGVAPNNKFYNLCAGTYTILAKDAQGCTATATVTLALPLSPVMNIGTITPVACFGGVGTIAVNITSATPPYNATSYTYQVSPVSGMGVSVSGVGGLNATYTGVPAGSYNLIITNANGCADTVFGVTMTQPAAALNYSSVVVDSVLCFGSATGSITAQGVDGTLGANSYQYSIKIGAAPFTPYSAPQLTPYTFTGLAAGTYTIRVRDHNLCTKDSIVSIYQPTKLNLLLDDVDNTCFGTSDGEICVLDTGGVPDYRYKLGAAGAYSPFQPAGAVYCFNNLAAGNYSIFTIDSKGCLDTLAVTVAAIPLPIVSYTAAPNDTVCDGTSITLSGTGADTYSWTGGITDGIAFTPPLGTSQYIVTGTNTTTGCENLDTANVLVNPIPVMNAIADQVVCNNTLTTAVFPNSSVATATYAWSHDATAAIGIGTNGTGTIPSFTAVNTGATPIIVTFTVTPTGPAITNCVGADITFTITINPDAIIALDPASGTDTQTVCIGQPINDIIYNITGGGTGGTVTVTLPTGVNGSYLGGVFTISGTPTGPAGIYPYTVSTTGSCAQTSASGTITVSPDAILTLTSPIGTDNQTVCINTTITNIVYSITGTGDTATVAGLPTGVTYAYVAGVLTISGSPSVSGPTTYTVTATGTCGSTSTTGIINVTPLQDPSFTYPSPTYCVTGIDPLPLITGATGGTFSATPAGLSINPTTGLIDLSASTSPVTYAVKYVTNGPCPDSSTFNVTITNAPSAVFSYSPLSYCQNGTNPLPIFQLVPPASGGVFTATPAGLDIDASTGEVYLATSASGTYTVTNFIAAAGGCASASATATIIIDSTTIMNAVPNVSVCNGVATAPINFSSTVGSSTYDWSHNGTGIGIASPGTGNIPSFTPINTGSTPIVVTFTVTPMGPTPNFCTGLPITFDLTINPDAFIALDPASGSTTQTLCIGDPVVDIIYNVSGGGTGASVLGLPGTLSGSYLGGVYTISGIITDVPGTYTYTVTTSGSCAQTTTTGTIIVSPNATLALTSGAATAAQMVCENELITNITYAIGGTGDSATVTGLPTGVTGTYAAGVFTISGSSALPGIYPYTVTATGTCGPTSLSGSLEIVPTQIAAFTYPTSTYCQTGTDPSPVFSALTATGGTFSATPAGLSINATTGIIDLSASTVSATAYVVEYVTPGPCPDSATFNILITNAPCATFVYTTSNYCQSGTDPLPTFSAGCSAGSFSATPAGLSINASTGEIDLSASNAGTYTVTNDIVAAGGCAAATASTTITIDSNTVMTDPADQTICNGAATTVVVPGGAVAGSTFTWTNSNTAIGLAAASGTGNVPSFIGVNNTALPVSTTITYTPTGPGPNNCVGVPQTFTITVDPDAKLTLTSAAATTNQSVCINTPITNIVYTIGGTGNNATVAGLPTGVSAPAPIGNVLTISGTPTVAGTYTYTVTATGSCGSTTSTGTIVVNPNATVTLTSAAATANQTVCLNSPITAITYTIGATGTASTVIGLPTGVTATPGTNITISGTPSVVGAYTYTVTGTGTCGNGTSTGVINVSPLEDPSFSYPSATVCNNPGTVCPDPLSIATPGGVFSVTPALSAAVFNTTTGCFTLPVVTTGSYTVKYVTPGTCKDSSTYTINIVTAPCTQFAYGATSYCQSSPNPTPTYSTGCTPGVFTASPVGLSINSSTGLINLLASTAGTYTVTNTIAASGSCPASVSTFTVTVVSKPVFTFVSTTPANCTLPCNGTVVSTITGGTGTYTCTISPATAPAAVSNTGTATGLCAGVTYTITATDAIGCTGTTTVSVVTATAPSISIVAQTNTTAPFPTCDGTATTLTTSGSGTYTYAIAGPGSPLINAAGFATQLCGDTACITYTITVTDVNTGCTDFDTVCINAPGLLNCSASHTNVTCFGGTNGTLADTVSGGTTPYTFVSLNNGPTPVPYTVFSSNVITASGLAAGTYVATWEDSNGITCTSIITITQPSQFVFTLPTINTPSCSTGCDGTLSISATGGTGALSYSIQTPVGVTCTATQSSPGNFGGLGVGTYTVIVTDINSCSGTTTVTINASTPPTISISHNNPSCNNVCDGTATAIGLGGTGTLTYSIQSPAGSTCTPTQSAPTSGSFTTLGGGTYTITVTDTKGCTASDTETLVNPAAIVIDTLTHTNPLCNGDCNGTIHTVASGGTSVLSYTLTPPTGPSTTNATGNFSGLCAGTYTVSAQDANCNITATVVITQPTAVSWVTTSSTNISCAGSANGIINTAATGGVNPIQYSKDGVTFGGSGNFTGLLAGTYTITAKDANSCTITTSFTIVEPPLLTLGAPVSQQITCNGASDGSITISAAGGTPGYVYNIIPAVAGSNTTGVFTGLPPGTYTINVTDTVGCSKASSGITITQPAPLIFTLANHQDVACYGGNTGTITLNTSGGTPVINYSILPVTGTQSPAGFFSGLIAGTYTVVATDANNCVVTSIVTINQGPEIVVMNFTATEPICNGDANGAISFTVIGGTGQLKYQLNGGPLQTDTVFNNLLAGNYLLTIVDALGCTKDIVISVKEPEPVGAIINLIETNCTDSKDGKAIIIGTGGRGGYKYYLTPGLHINKSGIFTGLEAGSYLLRVVDTTGCEYRTNIVINPPANPLSNVITKQDLACNGVGNEGTATANVGGGTPPYTYLWNTTPPQTTAQASTLYYGYYDVTVMDANGCTLKDTIYIEEGPCCEVSFIPNAFSPNGDQLNDEFRVLTTAGVELIQLEIYDRWGKRIWATIDYRRGWDGLIDGKDAANDTYYYIFRYKCTRDNSIYTKKGDLILIR